MLDGTDRFIFCVRVDLSLSCRPVAETAAAAVADVEHTLGCMDDLLDER